MAKNSSRGSSSRPRRLAGTTSPARPSDEPAADRTPEPTPEPTPQPPGEPQINAPAEPDDRLLGTPLVTRVLLAALLVVSVVVAVEAFVLLRDDDPAPAAPSAERPVVVGEQVFGPAVEAAGQSVQVLFGGGWETYDEDLEQARALMTDEFAEEYLSTKEDVREPFVEARTQVDVRLSAQGVVRASASQVQVLVFFDQITSKADEQTSFSQYRALVTMVDTAEGWLVSQVETE